MRLRMFIMMLLPLTALAQEPVAPVTGWMATVDSATQQIVLRWHPSADSATLGYHICTGNPCIDYDTVFGRFDTSYICLDHSPLEQHLYRLHVFDSAYNVSELTPAFGNVVLTAEVPDCETTVDVGWTPYRGIPDGQPLYTLQRRLEPFDTAFVDFYNTDDSTHLEHTFEIPEAATRIWLRVKTYGNDGFVSYSNIVKVERQTVDTATVVNISHIAYDEIANVINLTFEVDTAFEYTLYRSIDGTPWRRVTSFQSLQATYSYADHDINPYDSLHCYQLEVFDACGMNPRYSSTAWVVVPDPPEPAIDIPNAIIANEEGLGTFYPYTQGLAGDIYELNIYNRLGMLVFHSDNPAEGWTPTAESPQGAYVYMLRCRFNSGAIKTYSGTVTLIK